MRKVIDAEEKFKKHSVREPYHPNCFINLLVGIGILLCFATVVGFWAGVAYRVFKYISGLI